MVGRPARRRAGPPRAGRRGGAALCGGIGERSLTSPPTSIAAQAEAAPPIGRRETPRARTGGPGFIHSVAGGSVAAIWAIFSAVAFAGLVYAGPLAPVLSTGIAAGLLTLAVVSAVVVLRGEMAGMAVASISPVVPIYAAMAAALDASLQAGGVADPLLRGQAAILACGLVTVASGGALMLVGALRAGGLVRLLPYPVVAGYFAGLGWLFVAGGLSLGAGLGIDLDSLRRLDGPAGWQAAACIALAAMLLGLPRLRPHWAIMPGLLLAGGVIVHVVRVGLGLSIADAQAARWLLGPFPASGHLALPGAEAVGLALSAPVLKLVLPYAGLTALLSVLSLMLWITANELDARRSLRLNRELLLAGVANVVGGLSGGIACGQAYSTSKLLRQQGTPTRTAAMVPAVLSVALILAGPLALGWVPRAVIASLLLSTGFDFLVLRPARDIATLPRYEAASVFVVAAVVVWAGMVVGVLAGLALALVLFALGYARTPVIRAALARSACRSTVVRAADAERFLVEAGDAILLCRLQGHVFFLNASEIPATLARRPRGALRHLILDFRDVTGIDSSVHAAFERLCQIGADQGFRILLCGMRAEVERQFRERGILRDTRHAVSLVATADAALRDAEAQMLRGRAPLADAARWNLADQLSRLRGEPVSDARLAPFLGRRHLAPGETLLRQGETADAMYFLIEGVVATELSRTDGTRLRVSTAGFGTVIGELGLLHTGRRTATVMAESACELLVLTAESLDRMEREDPVLATLLHRYLLREVASKLADSTRLIEMQAL